MVRLTPSGGADRVDGVGQDAAGKPYLRARVRAAPEAGEANAALCGLIAKAVGAPRTAVSVVRGAQARLKELCLLGVTPSQLFTAFGHFLEPDDDSPPP